MKVAFLLSPQTAISGMSNGILKQSLMWIEGLRTLGITADYIGIGSDGTIPRLSEYDIVHFFQHGHWLKGFSSGPTDKQRWFFSPIIDSTASIRLYGLLAKIPMDHYLLSFGPRLLQNFSMQATVSARSTYEAAYLRAIAPEAKIERNPIALSIEEGKNIKPDFNIPKQFALFVGNVSTKRKNVYRLIKACEKAEIPLVIGGLEVNNAEMQRIQSCIDNSSVPILRLGFITKEELRWLYAHCAVFCLPSEVEGVGQVAMEALYFGAPIVVTEVGGARDYFTDFAEYVNPDSVESISTGIKQALKKSLSIENVRRHLENFSILNSAKCLLESYHRSF